MADLSALMATWMIVAAVLPMGLSEQSIRLTSFLGLLVILMVLEALAPRRQRVIDRWRRWPGNLGIAIVDTVVVRLFFPAAAVGVALMAQTHGWGLFNLVVWPSWLTIMLSVVALDLLIYAQHVAFHAVPFLWRVHRTHHSDPEIDTTTALRFHPIEIILSLLTKFTAIVALGVPPLAVLIFEVVLNASAMFNHGNIALPRAIDRVLRWVIVTPDMHRVHHSVVARETNSNFGFNLPYWDRLFGTYRAQPAAGHDAMTIGLADFRDRDDQRIDRLLIQPLRHGSTRGDK